MKKTLSTIMIVLTAIISLTLTTPQIESSTTNYNFVFIDNNARNSGGVNGGALVSTSSWATTELTPIVNNSIIFNNLNFTLVQFFNGSQYLGYYTNIINDEITTESTYLGTISLGNFLFPNNATHFALTAAKFTTNKWTQATSFSTFQTVSVSYSSSAPTNVNLAATITFPAITVGNEWSITSRGWLWTDDGTTPTLQNTLSPSPFNSPVGNNNQYIINPVLDYSTTYSYRQYVTDGTNIR
jgi:hypothetical protein